MPLIPPAIRDRLRRAVAALVLPDPTGVPGAQHSMILYDDRGAPGDRLLELALEASRRARAMDLRWISERITHAPRWPDRWPGEHYRLLAALVETLVPRVVVEIGTYQGLGALALLHALPAGGTVHTFDVVPTDRVPGTVLRDADRRDGRLVTHVANLTQAEVFESHRALLATAGLVFVDAAKDGVMERVLLERFGTLEFRKAPLVVLDDIRVWNMLRIWRDVTLPKLDLTSFGHWSGTGLIDWPAGRARPFGTAAG